MKKTFGNEPTMLELTPLAQKAYNNIDPITIIENSDSEGCVYGYDMIGCVQGKNMTYKEVNEALEAELVFTIKPEYLDRFGSEATEETQLDIYEIRDLARGWNMTVEEVVKMCEIL